MTCKGCVWESTSDMCSNRGSKECQLDMDFHRQCILEKGSKRQTSWIPEEYAKSGRCLELKDEKGNWDNGWKVVQIGGRKSSKEVDERSRDGKRLPSLRPRKDDKC